MRSALLYRASSRFGLGLVWLLFLVAPALSEDIGEKFFATLGVSFDAPNRFGLSGDAAWLEAGQKMVPVKPRKRVVEISTPGILDRADTEYRLMNDVEADGTAFVIKNHDITLNLNGHSVLYGKRPQGDENYGVQIGLWNFRNVAVLNGSIIQAEPYAPGGRGKRWETPYGTGSCPIWGRTVFGGEFAGLYIRYGGDDTSGINLWGSSHHIHHNTIEDVGTVVSDRHKGLAAIEGPAYPGRHVHHNLIIRTRHNGIRCGMKSKVHHNVVYVDSVETNSAGVSAGGEISNNKISGVGTHPLGVFVISNGEDDPVSVHENFVQVQNTRSSREYGSAGAAGVRYQSGGRVLVRDNTIIVQADADYGPDGFNSWGRAIWAGITRAKGQALFENNLVAAVARNGRGKAAGLAVVAGNISSALVFRNNTVISSWSPVLLADSYGHAGGYARFEGNTFVKAPGSPEFKTIRSQYSERPSTGTFISSRFVGGASYDDVDLELSGSGVKDIAIGWRVRLRIVSATGPALGALVTVTDANGEEVFSGPVDAEGKVEMDLMEYRLSNRGSGPQKNAVRFQAGESWRTPSTPHVISVALGAQAVTQKLVVDQDIDFEVVLP